MNPLIKISCQFKFSKITLKVKEASAYIYANVRNVYLDDMRGENPTHFLKKNEYFKTK